MWGHAYGVRAGGVSPPVSSGVFGVSASCGAAGLGESIGLIGCRLPSRPVDRARGTQQARCSAEHAKRTSATAEASRRSRASVSLPAVACAIASCHALEDRAAPALCSPDVRE